MDKQQLLKRFQTNYLSRQDVLFKLPLNISVDSFWPELLSWRKSRANMLPLYNANGQPLWFVTTDKMVRASERLCGEALDREDTFDPYRIQMTQELSNALTMESYFTSFIEGADYTLESAIAFLRRGTEPENQYEQNILNNYQALSYLLSALSVPIDEHYVKDLAFILTDGQLSSDEQNMSYRTADSAPIPAMDGEAYTVPAAFTLPNHMEQFYAFLGDNKMHPLIKAAVSQAFILTTRPFPEGNDRLARIISSAVLLRCGYDFFLDISLSSFIAKENFRYVKAMKEIIRTENEGDMTYFVEYYLTMLVRALDSAQAERAEQEREAERQMALQPLAPSPPAPTPTVFFNPQTSSSQHPMGRGDDRGQNGVIENIEEEIPPAIQFMTPEMMQSIQVVPPTVFNPQDGFPPENGFPPQEGIPEVIGEQSLTTPPQDVSWHGSSEGSIDSLIANSVSLSDVQPTMAFREGPSQSQADITVLEKAPEYVSILEKIAPLIPIENFAQKISTAINVGILNFSPMQWAEIHLIDNEEAIRECEVLYATGLADRYIRRGHFIYLFRFETSTELASLAREGRIRAPETIMTSREAVFWYQLALLEASKSDTHVKAALTIRQMISEGVVEFNKADWIDRTGMSDTSYGYCRHKMVEMGLIRNIFKSKNSRCPGMGIYRLTIADDSDRISPISDEISIYPEDHSPEPENHSPIPDDIQWIPPYREMTADEFLQTVDETDNSPIIQRICRYLSLRKDGLSFTANDWMCFFNISHSMAAKDMHRALNMGLLEPVGNSVKGESFQFRLTTSLIPSLRIDDLMYEKKVHLQKLYDRFSTDAFCAQDLCEVLEVKKQSISYRLDEFIDRGIIMIGRKGGQNYYRLTVTPKEHPECFQQELALVAN